MHGQGMAGTEHSLYKLEILVLGSQSKDKLKPNDSTNAREMNRGRIFDGHVMNEYVHGDI